MVSCRSNSHCVPPPIARTHVYIHAQRMQCSLKAPPRQIYCCACDQCCDQEQFVAGSDNPVASAWPRSQCRTKRLPLGPVEHKNQVPCWHHVGNCNMGRHRSDINGSAGVGKPAGGTAPRGTAVPTTGAAGATRLAGGHCVLYALSIAHTTNIQQTVCQRRTSPTRRRLKAFAGQKNQRASPKRQRDMVIKRGPSAAGGVEDDGASLAPGASVPA